MEAVVTRITRRDPAAGVTMIRLKSQLAGGAAVAALSLAVFYLAPANGAVAGVARLAHPATGVGSCTLKNPDPKLAARNPAKLPLGERKQTYRPDNYDCDGAAFARPGVEFRRFPQPRDYRITNRKVVRLARVCQLGTCSMQRQIVWEPTQSINPLAPFFPPFTHFVLLLRENHT